VSADRRVSPDQRLLLKQVSQMLADRFGCVNITFNVCADRGLAHVQFAEQKSLTEKTAIIVSRGAVVDFFPTIPIETVAPLTLCGAAGTKPEHKEEL